MILLPKGRWVSVNQLNLKSYYGFEVFKLGSLHISYQPSGQAACFCQFVLACGTFRLVLLFGVSLNSVSQYHSSLVDYLAQVKN